MAHIHQGKYQPDIPVLGEVALNEGGPAELFLTGNLGVSITGQVYKAHLPAPEKVDGGGFAGVALTRARDFWLNSLLIREDFLTLERPAKTSSGIWEGGSWSSRPKEVSNRTC